MKEAEIAHCRMAGGEMPQSAEVGEWEHRRVFRLAVNRGRGSHLSKNTTITTTMETLNERED